MLRLPLLFTEERGERCVCDRRAEGDLFGNDRRFRE